MEDMIFNKEKRSLNKLYLEIFGIVPCMQDYNCSREQYIEAMKKSINTKIAIEKILPLAEEPIEKDVLI